MKKKEDNAVFTKGCIQIVMKLFTKLILFSNRRVESFYCVNYGSSIITSIVRQISPQECKHIAFFLCPIYISGYIG
mgnify:CR=1 FL=1